MRRRRRLLILVFIGGAIVIWRRVRSGTGKDSPITHVSRAQRTTAMGRLAARRTTDRTWTKARQRLASDETRRRLQADLERRDAEDVVSALGNMKGAMMKLGQMASYLDEGMPGPMREALAGLRSDAPPMPGDLALSEIERSLGAPLHELFREIDSEPMASASIGQVHRAITADGRKVAVKVQYPGIAGAIAADLDNSEALAMVLSMVFPGLDPNELVGELRERVTEELDYVNEASNVRAFVDYYRGHPHIWIPDVIEELSTGDVLTTELVEGARFEEIYERPQEERDRIGEILYRFVFRSLNRQYVFNGDPHPGNYLLAADGRLAFIDFGLVKHFEENEVQQFARLIRAMLDRDAVEFRRTAEEVKVLRPGAPFSDDEIFDWFAAYYELILENKLLTVTPEYSARLLFKTFDARTNEILKHANVPPTFALIQRINLGLFSLMGKLEATANWRAISEELWVWTDAGPSTPMGEDEAAWVASGVSGAGR
ncbi:MAG: AarF/ABC1/UbiB kinase family protein [Acidimicrobiales bacterium]|nr:AarF/ABC1/UbiB kinase family protein [Acidimicrobiales bacterium]MDG2218560.1 AarF/ABC1/UbiB kinase family protein [Acidimicrobiales bacterium]